MGLFTKIIDLQKLGAAWEHVKANHPTEGADGVSVEAFEAGRKENLMQLHIELVEKRYQPEPIKIVSIQKNGKVRKIGLVSMRDKVVQQSIQQELSKKYEPFLSENCYAYRSRRSALAAVEKLDMEIKRMEGRGLWVYKGDITDFFETIVLNQLLLYLEKHIYEKELLELIKICLYAPYIDEDGITRKKGRGIFQGSSLSPVLSNIYMMEFDHKMENLGGKYFRYSDDFLFLGNKRQEMEERKKRAEEALGELGLTVKPEKTVLCPIENGVDFLGYHFNEKGKEIPVKAEKGLTEKLEAIWLESGNRSMEEKLETGCGIINGWAQYYPEIWRKKNPDSIYEFVIMLHLAIRRRQEELEDILYSKRKQYKNIHKDIMLYLCSVWEKTGREDMILYEYEQYFDIEEADQEKMKKVKQENREVIGELRKLYGILVINETERHYADIIQVYTDLSCYNKAEKLLEWKKKTEPATDMDTEEYVDDGEEGKQKEVKLTEKEQELYMELFVAREDIFAQASVRENGKRYFETVSKPLLAQEIDRHLSGEKTIASYIRRSNNTVKYMVFDIDLSKKVLLKYERKTQEFEEYLIKAKKMAFMVMKKLKKTGISGWLEYSGYRGYHVWVFFSEWISCRYVQELQRFLLEGENWEQDGDINLELFPNRGKMREGQAGQLIKLPFGRHDQSGEITCFLDETGHVMKDQKNVMEQAYDSRVSFNMVKRILARGTEVSKKKINFSASANEEVVEKEIKDLGRQPERIVLILRNCGFLRYLCMKAKNTGYLTHRERLSILYVFGHIGEQGREFIHTVMEFTLNYQYAVTEKFILKCPAKPISCIKLQEQYKMVTAEIGCNCNFRGMKNCYPSPVLHILKNDQDIPQDVTVPSVRTVTKEKEKELYNEINIHNKTEELALKLIEMKKQKRGVDRVIKKYEEELGRIFDNAGIDCVELEIGMLLRKKTDLGYEWIIAL